MLRCIANNLTWINFKMDAHLLLTFIKGTWHMAGAWDLALIKGLLIKPRVTLWMKFFNRT